MCAQTNPPPPPPCMMVLESTNQQQHHHKDKWVEPNLKYCRCPEFECGGWGHRPRLISGSRVCECAVNGSCAWVWINHVFVWGCARLFISSQTRPHLCKLLPTWLQKNPLSKDVYVIGSAMVVWLQRPGLCSSGCSISSSNPENLEPCLHNPESLWAHLGAPWLQFSRLS